MSGLSGLALSTQPGILQVGVLGVRLPVPEAQRMCTWASASSKSLCDFMPGCTYLWAVQPSLRACLVLPITSCESRPAQDPAPPSLASTSQRLCQSQAPQENKTLMEDEKGVFWWLTRQAHCMSSREERRKKASQSKQGGT